MNNKYFVFYSLRDDDTILTLDQARQLSAKVQEMQSHLSVAMQIDFVCLGGRLMLQPVINMLQYDSSLVKNMTSNLAENFDFFSN